MLVSFSSQIIKQLITAKLFRNGQKLIIIPMRIKNGFWLYLTLAEVSFMNNTAPLAYKATIRD
jgi:hypothetical protein